MGQIHIIFDYLKEFNMVSVLLRLFLAVIIGGIIGFERGRHGSAAGFRTHILVCVGATMTSLCSLYASLSLQLPGDIFRLSAQVISGIGFLGAGIILVRNNSTVAGLTTAAGMWVTATIGLALGYGFYSGALIGTVICVSTTTLLTRLERKTKQSIHFYAEIQSSGNVQRVLDEVESILEKDMILEVIPAKSGILGNVGINVTTTPRHSSESIRDSLLKIEGISYVVKA
ncbi:MAG: MgtC/SapB family protein [Clostridiales bacterium]|nr:MgtC/SapB family protein [Clostridiales bacterium]